jgi:hypothetical protein
MRPDLLALFDRGELKKYMTDEELPPETASTSAAADGAAEAEGTAAAEGAAAETPAAASPEEKH